MAYGSFRGSVAVALGGSLALLQRDLLSLVMAIEAQNQAEAFKR